MPREFLICRPCLDFIQNCVGRFFCPQTSWQIRLPGKNSYSGISCFLIIMLLLLVEISPSRRLLAGGDPGARHLPSQSEEGQIVIRSMKWCGSCRVNSWKRIESVGWLQQDSHNPLPHCVLAEDATGGTAARGLGQSGAWQGQRGMR